MRLIIANRNYSSWSIRPMFFMRQMSIACEEVMMPLEQPGFATDVLKVSPTGRVPVLQLADGEIITDSLAIGLSLSELFPDKRAFPLDSRLRRMAYSACAEMHSSFSEMRRVLTCNLRKRYVEDAWRAVAGGPEAEARVVADVLRVQELWNSLLQASGGPYLAGDFGFVDAFFVPVVSRFRTYGMPLDSASETYARTIEAMPKYAALLREAAAEPNVIAKYEYAIPLAK
jgi:glutathione S-transferase